MLLQQIYIGGDFMEGRRERLGRVMGGIISIPPVLQSLYLKGFQQKTGGMRDFLYLFYESSDASWR